MKTTTNIVIDSDLKELVKIRRFKDPSFSLSKLINDFLRDYFDADVKNLKKDKVEMEVVELEKKLALAKSQKQALDVEEERQKKEDEKIYGVEFNPDED